MRSAGWPHTVLWTMTALIALAVPPALFALPPVLDLPNHLARLWLLSGGAAQVPLSAVYAPEWSQAWTNIGIDILAATLGRLVGGIALGRTLFAVAVVLPPLGAVVLNRALFGGRHWWQVGFAVLAWNTTLLMGFLNFQIGLGLALLAAAADPGLARCLRSPALAATRVGMGTGLLVWHLFAAGFYGVLLAGLAFGTERTAFAGRAPFVRATLRAALTVAPALGLPLLVFWVIAPVLPGGKVPEGVNDYAWVNYSVMTKLGTLLSAVSTYDLRVDTPFVLALWVLARPLASAVALRAHAGLLLAAAGLLALALLMPPVLAATGFIDYRFPIMAALVGIAAIRPGMATPRQEALATAALLLLALARTGWIGAVWWERQQDAAAIERTLAAVPAGSAVLPVEWSPADLRPAPVGRLLAVGVPTFWHFPTMAVPWRRAFVPTLFTAAGEQPLTVLPPWNAIAVPQGVPIPSALLDRLPADPQSIYLAGYAGEWRQHFDYILLIDADLPSAPGSRPLPNDLVLLVDAGFARLYRVPPRGNLVADHGGNGG